MNPAGTDGARALGGDGGAAPRRVRWRRLGLGVVPVAAALAWWASCGDEPERRAMPVRLADAAWLGKASIESPLNELVAAASIAELSDVARKPVLHEDFENFDAAAAGWKPLQRARVRALPAAVGSSEEPGHAFNLRRCMQGDRFGWVRDARPGTHYVFERRVRTDTPLTTDFVVLEAKKLGPEGLPGMFRKGYMAGQSVALKFHWPPRPPADGAWHTGSVSLFTSPLTRSLVVLAIPLTSAADAPTAGSKTWFDDLRLDRAELTAAQSMQLLMARCPAPDAPASAPGESCAGSMAKYGQFPPVRDAEGAWSPTDSNFSYRHALYAPPKTVLSYPLTLGEGAVFRFSTALSRETRQGDAARFSVTVRDGGASHPVFEQKLSAAGEEWCWHEHREDLSAFAGRPVELVLTTEAAIGAPHPVWGAPVIDVPDALPGPRNVILIAVDTLRADRMSCYGYDLPTTPYIDRLAGDGVRFENVACNANWTCPSFASIFTGVVPSRHGVFAFAAKTPLPGVFRTLAERLRDAGWATHSIVYKAPLYDGGYEQGFDVAKTVPRVEIRAESNYRDAMEWLELNSHRRNFLFLHFNDPHQPFTQPDRFSRMFGVDAAAEGIDLPYSLYRDGLPEDEAGRAKMSALYDQEVTYVDDRIGAFLEGLRKRGLYDDAAIVFVSDHGEQLWERGRFGHAGGMLHDEVARVPLIVKPPGGIPAAARGSEGPVVVSTQVRAFDVMPTLLEFAGVDPGGENTDEQKLDAESLLPLLDGTTRDEDRLAVIETSDHFTAIRTSRWKYICCWGRQGSSDQLFDLQKESTEKTDVAAAHPGVVARMGVKLMDYFLRNRPGWYLLMVGKRPPEERRFDVAKVSSAVTLRGFPLRRAGPRLFRYEGRPKGPLVALVDLEFADTVVIEGREFTRENFRAYEPGELIELLEGGELGVHLFKGPDRVVTDGSGNPLDPDLQNAMDNLGYTGGKAGKKPKKKK